MKVDAEIINLYKIMLYSKKSKMNITQDDNMTIIRLYHCGITDCCSIDKVKGISGGRIIGYWNRYDNGHCYQ